MRLPLRSYMFFGIGLLGATFGMGATWRLALALRAGTAGVAEVIEGSIGLISLLLSAVILTRFVSVLMVRKAEARHGYEGSKGDDDDN